MKKVLGLSEIKIALNTVTGKGQKTSSVLRRAFSRLRVEDLGRDNPIVWPKLEKTQVLFVRRDRRDSTWILRGPSLVLFILHQICRTSYYWRYLEHTYSMSHYPCRYESCRVMQTSSQNESVSNESLRVIHEYESLRVIPNPEMSIHITVIRTYRVHRQWTPTLCLRLGRCLHTWSWMDRYDVRPVSNTHWK